MLCNCTEVVTKRLVNLDGIGVDVRFSLNFFRPMNSCEFLDPTWTLLLF